MTHRHTCGQLWQKYNFRVCKTRHQIWILEDWSQWHRCMELCYVLSKSKKSQKYWRNWGSGAKLTTNGIVWIFIFFCAALETARDVIDKLFHEVNLSQHPFEEHMIADQTEKQRHKIKELVTYTNLVELFVDDFIAATSNPSLSHLTHLSMSMLQWVYYISTPTKITKHRGQDQISQKQLSQGEVKCNTMKGILWWLIDGANFNLQLMTDKWKIAHLKKENFKLKSCNLKNI